MISETYENIFNLKNPSVILNQSNALGYAAVGIMKNIRLNYPTLFAEYLSLCKWHNQEYKHQFELLGTIQALPFPNSKNILCNAFTQKYLTNTKFEIDSNAWHTVCKKIIKQTNENYKHTNVMYEIHCLNSIGPGMNSYELEEVHNIIDFYFAESNIPFIYHA